MIMNNDELINSMSTFTERQSMIYDKNGAP